MDNMPLRRHSILSKEKYNISSNTNARRTAHITNRLTILHECVISTPIYIIGGSVNSDDGIYRTTLIEAEGLVLHY